MKASWTTLSLAVLLLSACGARNIPPGSTFDPNADSAVLLMGFAPRSRIHLVRGAVESGVWQRPVVDVPEVNAFPEDGYVLVRAKPTRPDQRMGVSRIFDEAGSILTGGRSYGPCNGTVGPTFELRAGAVTYVGDLRYSTAAGGLEFAYGVDEAKARAFLEQKYPSYAAALRTQPMVPMKVRSDACEPKVIVVPVFTR